MPEVRRCESKISPSCWRSGFDLCRRAAADRGGPYRFLAHPHYLVVILEFTVLPLLLSAPYTLAFFFPVNLLILRQRMRLEEEALREFTDYKEKFPSSSPCSPSPPKKLLAGKPGPR